MSTYHHHVIYKGEHLLPEGVFSVEKVGVDELIWREDGKRFDNSVDEVEGAVNEKEDINKDHVKHGTERGGLVLDGGVINHERRAPSLVVDDHADILCDNEGD